MSSVCLKRLKKEFKEIQKNPPSHIRAAPLENNLLEWHYVIEGVKGTPYEHGWYHDYPYKPPSIMMYTPNGRFREATRLCFSMSDFHPELWNTSWSVSTILVGLQSFMNEDTTTAGSITTSVKTKKQLAKKTMYFNVKDKNFCSLFPELVQLHQQKLLVQPELALAESEEKKDPVTLSLESMLAIVVTILVCFGAIILSIKTEL